jgi:predicted RNA-binding protein with PUA-like domain
LTPVPGPPVVARLRDGTAVAAWLFKANPDVWDVVGFLRSGAEVDHWRMARSYRVGLLRAGHPCALWVTSGSGPDREEPGLRAVGEITGAPFEDVGDPADHRWRDPGAQRQVRPYAPTRMRALDRPLPRTTLEADPRWSTAEILRVPRLGSPLAITPAEWEAVLDSR